MPFDISPEQLPALANYPAATPPPGVKPNFINPYSQANVLIVVGSVFVGLMVMFGIARLYVKAFMIRKATWDDLTCVLALLGTIVELVTASIVAKAGVGTHQWDLTIGALINNRFIESASIFVVVLSPTLLFAKLSFFLLYLQIFWPNVKLRWAIYVGIFITTAFYIATTICQFYFNIPLPGQSFLSRISMDLNSPTANTGVATAAFGIISDFYLLLLPIFGVWQLQMPTRRKIGVIVVFATGLLACICSVIGLYYRLRSKVSSDGTWDLLPTMLTAIIEAAVGVICVCMPACKNLVHHHSKIFESFRSYFTSLGSRSKSSSSKSSSYSDASKETHSRDRRGYVPAEESYTNDKFQARQMQYAESPNLELGQYKSIKTYIHRGAGGAVEEDGIHLKRDIQQTWGSAPRPKNGESRGF